jgi:hypothetical protein
MWTYLRHYYWCRWIRSHSSRQTKGRLWSWTVISSSLLALCPHLVPNICFSRSGTMPRVFLDPQCLALGSAHRSYWRGRLSPRSTCLGFPLSLKTQFLSTRRQKGNLMTMSAQGNWKLTFHNEFDNFLPNSSWPFPNQICLSILLFPSTCPVSIHLGLQPF